MRSVLNRSVGNRIKNGHAINICIVLKCIDDEKIKRYQKPLVYDSELPGIHIQQYAYHIKCISYVYVSVISVL